MKWHLDGPFSVLLWKPPTIKKVHSNRELGPRLCPGHSCLWFNEAAERWGNSLFMQSRCCRVCTQARFLQLLQSTQPGQYQIVGQWPRRGNWLPLGTPRDPPFSGSSCNGRQSAGLTCNYEAWWGKSIFDNCMTNLPDTVHHSIVGFLISSLFEWL